MKDDEKNTPDNTRKKPVVIPASEVAKSPKAEENIRLKPEETEPTKPSSKGINSEITDGEDA